MYVDDAQGWSTRGEKNFPEMTRMSQEELNARSERIKLNSKRSIAELEKQNAKLTSKKLEADVDQRIAKRKSDMDNAQAKYNKFMQRYNAAGSSQKLAMSGTKDKLEKELTQSKALHKAASRTRDKDVADAKRLKITEHKEGVLRELKNEINSGDLQGQDLIDAKKKADLLHFELNEMNSSLQADMTAPFGMQREEYERARLEDDYGKEDDALGEVLDQEPEVARMQSTTLDEVVIEGKKEAKADAEQELNTPLGEIDNDYLKKLLDQKDKRLEKTGLKSIVDKYGGVDALLQMTGMYAAYKVATGEMPKQERSDAWKDRMQTLKDRTQLGLSNQTKTLMQRQAERTYAMDVHNIGHMATSGQAALGALGSASMRKYESDMKMGAMDAELREKHNNEYDSALVRDEAMKQEHWKRNVYDEANRKRELKAGLIGQAVKNVRENIQYNQQYGDGSLHQQYMQSMIDETRANERSTLASQFYMMKDAGATKEEIDAAFGAEKDE